MYVFGIRKWRDEAREKAVALNEYENRLIAAEKELEGKTALFEERLRLSDQALTDEKQRSEEALADVKQRSDQALADEKLRSEKALADAKQRSDQALADERKRSEDAKAEMKENYRKALDEIRDNHRETLKEQAEAYHRQSDALKAKMVAKTEEILKQRQAELDKKATETFESITGNLGKDLKEMKTAFEENKTRSSEESATLKEKFDNAVRQLAEQSRSIGNKADHLAEAMRGQKKMQGCWGETILRNLLDAEGMVEGRDYDKEETLRDELGFVLLNEDTDKRMRPDYLLHFVDNQDVVIDSKVSLSAFADYLDAQSDEARSDAAARNLTAFKEQVKRLSVKKYNDYLKKGRRMVDYVIMFVPNYPALQLAYNSEPKLWQWAYEQKVLITSAETLMPFLRTIILAWRNVEQVKNQQKIIESAQNMISRVADFASSMQTLGKKLADAQDAYQSADKKLRNSGQGILVSAHQVVNLGVPAKKALPEPDYDELTDQ